MKTIESQKVLYSPGKNDECVTPDYAVWPIMKYLPPCCRVWCPFDTAESNYVMEMAKKRPDLMIQYSHIFHGRNFFDYEPAYPWDVMVSNPPFTNKRRIFERAMSFGKPFALLMSNTWLNHSAPKKIFGSELQLLLFYERIHFEVNGITEKKTTFSSSYFCWNFLPRQIIAEHLERSGDNQNYKFT